MHTHTHTHTHIHLHMHTHTNHQSAAAASCWGPLLALPEREGSSPALPTWSETAHMCESSSPHSTSLCPERIAYGIQLVASSDFFYYIRPTSRLENKHILYMHCDLSRRGGTRGYFPDLAPPFHPPPPPHILLYRVLYRIFRQGGGLLQAVAYLVWEHALGNWWPLRLLLVASETTYTRKRLWTLQVLWQFLGVQVSKD